MSCCATAVVRRQLLLKFFEEINIFFILILFYVKQGRALIKIFKRYQYIFLNKLLFVFDKNSPSRAVRRQLCDGLLIKIFKRNQYIFYINFGLC